MTRNKGCDQQSLSGRLLYYDLGDVAAAGVVKSEGRKTYTVIEADGRERSVPVSDLVYVSSVPAGRGDRDLLGHGDQVLEQLRRLELRPVWELLVEEGVSATSPEEVVSFCQEDAGEAVLLDAVNLCLRGKDSFFKLKGSSFAPVSPKIIEQKELQARREEEKLARLRHVAEQLVWLREGRTTQDQLSPETTAALVVLRQTALLEVDSPSARPYLEVLFPSRRTPPDLLAFRYFVECGIWSEHEDLNLIRHQFSNDFSDEVQVEASLIARSVERLCVGRPDRSDLLPVAIDDDGTVEIDDALAVESLGQGFVVHVFIADVSSAVPKGGAVDKAASERCFTLYHPTGLFPMLPKCLGAEALSLVPGHLRLAVDHALYFDADLCMYDLRVSPCVVCVHQQITYGEADALLSASGDTPTGPQSVSLRTLWTIASKLEADRHARGAVSFYSNEARATIRDEEIRVKSVAASDPSRRLVLEFMVAAGAAAGHYLAESQASAIFRSQTMPDTDLAWTAEKARDPSYIFETVRKLKRAEISTAPSRHAGLAVEEYCQVTSPLRRYSDLAVQRQLLSLVTTGTPACSPGEMLQVAGTTEQAALVHRKTEQAANRYWLMEYLLRSGQTRVQARILDVSDRFTTVRLDETCLVGRFHPTSPVAPGDSVQLEVVRCDPRMDTLVLKD